MTRNASTVFAISALTLCLEFTAIRIMGFSHWFHLVYFTITLALLGFAIGGTLLSVSSTLQKIESSKFFSVCLIGFSVTTVLGTRLAVSSTPNILELIHYLGQLNFGPALKAYVPTLIALALPFVFASLIICRSLSESTEHSNRVYAWNLAGTAVGAILFLALIGPLGAYRLMYLIVGVGLILAIVHAKGRSVGLVAIAVVGLFGTARGLVDPHAYFFPSMDMSKNLAPEYPGKIIETKWTPMFRVDMGKTENGVRITIDGDGQTETTELPSSIVHSNEPYVPVPETAGRYALAHLVEEPNRRRSLVIGAGGGMEVLANHKMGFQKVHAVDIDPIRLDWLKGKYSYLLDDLFLNPKIETHVADGRNFVARTDHQFDAITLFAVDSLAGATTGAYNLVENYLYTIEAFQDYFSKLTKEGVLHISRPNWGGDTEMIRMFNTFVLLGKRNNLQSEKHLLVVQNGIMTDMFFAKEPFRSQNVLSLQKHYETFGEKPTFLFRSGSQLNDKNLDRFGLATPTQWNELIEAWATDVRPVTDNRPFFFENRRWDREPLASLIPSFDSQYNNWSGFILQTSMLISLIAFIFLAALCYFKMADRPAAGLLNRSVIYFGALGLGYMFTQIVWIQRMSLVLGHPIYSMALVIPSLLIGMGISSALISSSKYRGLLRQICLASPFIVILFFESAYPLVYAILGASSQWMQFVITALVMMTLGFALGFPFSSGLRAFGSIRSSLIPIAWCANGGMSVFGSLGAIFISMIFGYQASAVSSAICYITAFIAIYPLITSPHKVEQSAAVITLKAERLAS